MSGSAYIHFSLFFSPVLSPSFHSSIHPSTHLSACPPSKHSLSPYSMPGAVQGTRKAAIHDTPELGEQKFTRKETQ